MYVRSWLSSTASPAELPWLRRRGCGVTLSAVLRAGTGKFPYGYRRRGRATHGVRVGDVQDVVIDPGLNVCIFYTGQQWFQIAVVLEREVPVSGIRAVNDAKGSAVLGGERG
ncbi:hypothetical protein D3C73_1165770 [compost metagenome]